MAEQWACAEDQEHDQILPGFRFHPTDEELVGFYLRRKVAGRPIGLDIIKQIDIYKYDPWELPKAMDGVEKEWYFFCHRARKYRNSVRPNRVTGSGFWKATGIDKQVLSAGSGGRVDACIGLKKSLVYYRGSAGKGVKTDWMMHEFRLPPADHAAGNYDDAEVWTICKILKRNVSGRKPAQHLLHGHHGISAGSSVDVADSKEQTIIDRGKSGVMQTCTGGQVDVEEQYGGGIVIQQQTADAPNPTPEWELAAVPSLGSSRTDSSSCSSTSATDEIGDNVNWDDLGSLMDIIFEPITSEEHFYLQTSAAEELVQPSEDRWTLPYACA